MSLGKKHIGLVVAIETDAVAEVYGELSPLPCPPGFKEYRVKRDNYVLHIIQVGMGEIAAAAGVSYLATKYPISLLVNFGVAGGLTAEMAHHKICLVERVVHYKYDCSEFLPLAVGQVDGHDSPFLPIDRALLKCALSFSSDLLPVTCASGDKFVGTAEEKSSLHERFEGDICDMESAGIVLTSEAFGIPCLLFKAVSDGLSDGAAGFFAELKSASIACLRVADQTVTALLSRGGLKTPKPEKV